jgi:hypothetical protein
MGLTMAWMRGLLIVIRVLLSVALVAGYPLQMSAAGDGFNATFEIIGGAHRMFRDGIDHPAVKIGAWSVDGASHEVTVQMQIEDIFGKLLPSQDELKLTLPADGKQVERTILFEPGLGYFSIHAQFERGQRGQSRMTLS